MTGGASAQADSKTVEQFWAFARDHVGWTTLEGIFGQQQVSSVIPPWMVLAEDAGEATALVRQLAEVGTLEVATPATEFPEDGSLPQRGDLAIICDGAARPVALAATLEVRVSEGEGSAGNIVTEKLRCLYPPQAGKTVADVRGSSEGNG